MSDRRHVPFSRDELGWISNALNEILHGPEAIEDWEFSTRIGGTRDEVSALLQSLERRWSERPRTVDSAQIHRLLDELCVDLGFCLPPAAQQELVENPGTDVDAFTDRVIVAEGMDPISIDGQLRKQIRERVARVLAPGERPWPPERRKR